MSNKKEKAIILLSGGMDSCTCIAQSKADGFDPFALHLNYGQKTEARELKSFKDICSHYEIGTEKQLIVDISHLKKIGGSSLVDESMKIKMDGELSGADEIPNSYVPFRNAHILSIAVSWAEVVGAKALYFGAVQEDSSGYPDCREEFIKAFENTANLGTGPNFSIKIKTPLLHLSKGQIVKQALNLKAPLHLSWSCYSNQDYPCLLCDSCLLRAKGFKEANTKDPLL